MGEPSVFQYAEPQVSRVLSQVASHTLEQRCIQQHSVHGLLPHYWVRSISISIMNTITDRMSIRTESSTFSILSPHVQLELTGALLLPNVLRTHGKELPTNLINRIFVFFSSDHCKGIEDISLYCSHDSNAENIPSCSVKSTFCSYPFIPPSSSSSRSTKSFSALNLSPKLFGTSAFVLVSLSSPLAFALSSPPPNTELELVAAEAELNTLPNVLLFA